MPPGRCGQFDRGAGGRPGNGPGFITFRAVRAAALLVACLWYCHHKRAREASLKSLTDYQCSLSPPADVPVFLYAEDLIPLPRFSHVRKILGPGRRLLVMVDVAQGMQVDVPFEDRIFRMSTGAIRLATMANADLIPCLIAEICTWKFVIRFGAPVPRQHLGNTPDIQAIGAHLLSEFSEVVSRYPEQCRIRLARAMWPLTENRAKRSAVSPTVTLSDSV